MATAKQKAAARRNIKKAQAARRKKAGKRKTKRKTTAKRRKTTRKSAPRKSPKRVAAARKAARTRKRNAAKKSTRKRSTRKRSTRRRSATVSTVRERIIKLPSETKVKVIRVEGSPARRRSTKKRRRRSTHKRNPIPMDMQALQQLSANPMPGSGYMNLYENPMGPFSMTTLKAFGVAAVGVGFGFGIGDLVDRAIATRTPKDGTRPWYGRNAAAAQRQRPDAWRFAGQGGVALAGIAGAYYTRGRSMLPFLFGGIALGAGGNIVKMALDWFALPAILKVEDPGEESWANRLVPLEQFDVQDKVASMFENYGTVPSLAAGQAETPSIQSPLSSGDSIYTLGHPQGKAGDELQGLPRAGQLVQTGRVGLCPSCGGINGCQVTCPLSDCDSCKDGGNGGGSSTYRTPPPTGRLPECEYQVQRGDDIYAIAAAGNVTVGEIAAMNGGGTPDTWWQPGNTVRLPFGACKVIERNGGGGGGGGQTTIPQQPGGGGQTTTQRQPSGGGGQMTVPRQAPRGGGGGPIAIENLIPQPVRPTIAGAPQNQSFESQLINAGAADDEDTES